MKSLAPIVKFSKWTFLFARVGSLSRNDVGTLEERFVKNKFVSALKF